MPKAKREEEPPFTVRRGGAIAGRGSVDFVVLDICATLSVIPGGDAFRIDAGVFACVCTVHKCAASSHKGNQSVYGVFYRVSVTRDDNHNAATPSPTRDMTRSWDTPESQSALGSRHASATSTVPRGGPGGRGGSSRPVNSRSSRRSWFVPNSNSCSVRNSRPVQRVTEYPTV